ncbi:General transcription factor 3C polypeptide 2 [Chytriomyces hyalinus]|nr:General transcription factor 3C polypeptide 2 [Chytriomyces hyalinus]
MEEITQTPAKRKRRTAEELAADPKYVARKQKQKLAKESVDPPALNDEQQPVEQQPKKQQPKKKGPRSKVAKPLAPVTSSADNNPADPAPVPAVLGVGDATPAPPSPSVGADASKKQKPAEKPPKRTYKPKGPKAPKKRAKSRVGKYWHLESFASDIFIDDDAKFPSVRPIYPTVRPAKTNFVQVSETEKQSYIPKAVTRNLESMAYAKANEGGDRFELPPHSARSLEAGEKNRKKFVLNFGGSVWGLDWAKVNDSKYQYVAIGGYRNNAETHCLLNSKQTLENPVEDSLKGCVQIWKIDTSGESDPTLEIGFLLEYGVVYGLEWGSGCYFEDLSDFESEKHNGTIPDSDLPRLGLLAVSFGDGSCRIINVPHPAALKSALDINPSVPAFVKCQDFLFSAVVHDTLLWKPSWGGTDFLATGCANGNIAVWDIRTVMESKLEIENPADEDPIEPAQYFPAHNTAIFKVQWDDDEQGEAGALSGYRLVSGGADGQILVHDLRDPWASHLVYKLRGIVTGMAIAPKMNAFVVADYHHSVHYFRSTEPDTGSTEVIKTGMCSFPLESDSRISKSVSGHLALVWDMEVPPLYPFVASVSVDGCAKMSNLNRTVTKSFRPIQHNLYQLGYDSETQTFKYIEDTPEEDLGDLAKKGESPTILFPPEIALQKVSFNKNKGCIQWVATGGTAGLVRIETVFDES